MLPLLHSKGKISRGRFSKNRGLPVLATGTQHHVITNYPPHKTSRSKNFHQDDYVQCSTVATPQHFLNFFPLPQGHGSLRPTLGCSR